MNDFLFLKIRCLRSRKAYCSYNSKKTPLGRSQRYDVVTKMDRKLGLTKYIKNRTGCVYLFSISFVKIDLFSDPFRKNVISSKEDEQVFNEQKKILAYPEYILHINHCEYAGASLAHPAHSLPPGLKVWPS